jgi:hypothetical protein
VTGINTTLAAFMARNMLDQIPVSPLQIPRSQLLIESLVNASTGRINGHVLSQLGIQFANMAT